jgi:hypothetical protein
MKPRYFRIDAVVRTFADPETFPEGVEDVLDTYWNVTDLSVYEVLESPEWKESE